MLANSDENVLLLNPDKVIVYQVTYTKNRQVGKDGRLNSEKK